MQSFQPFGLAQYRAVYSAASGLSRKQTRPPSQWIQSRSSQVKNGHAHVLLEYPPTVSAPFSAHFAVLSCLYPASDGSPTGLLRSSIS